MIKHLYVRCQSSPRYGGQEGEVEVDVGDALLHEVLLLLVVGDVVTHGAAQVEVHPTRLLYDEVGLDHAVQTEGEGDQEAGELHPGRGPQRGPQAPGRGARGRALALGELDLEVCLLGGGDTGEGAVVRDRGGGRGDEGSSVRHDEAVWGGGSYSLGQSSAETDPITRVTNTVQVTRTLTLRDSQQHCTCYRSQVSNYW